MHELYILKNIAEQQLLPAGYVLDVEENHPDHFGSYFCVFSRGAHKIRFVWDGRDGWGFLEHCESDSDTWKPIGAPVAEASEAAMRASANREWPESLSAVMT